MGKQLLREYYQLCEGGVCQDLLTEEEKRMIREDNVMILTGVMQMCGVKNGNGRMYTESVMKREVKKYQQLVEAQQALGELDHPQEIEISLVNVSHKVTSIWMDDNKVMGKIQVLNTAHWSMVSVVLESLREVPARWLKKTANRLLPKILNLCASIWFRRPRHPVPTCDLKQAISR